MAHRVKCVVCNSCMVPRWVGYDRYYYCDFCLTYYEGRDGELTLVDKDVMYKLIQENQDANKT
jgi:hypothetical protein